MVLAMFRLIPILEGTIEIDGVDIRSIRTFIPSIFSSLCLVFSFILIALKDLRSRIGIIPQDPVFFNGSIRNNLDPFDSFEDEAIWTALEEVGIKDYVADLEGKLEAPVEDGGRNFSAGYRQLLNIARVFLKKPRVLIMDEVPFFLSSAVSPSTF